MKHVARRRTRDPLTIFGGSRFHSLRGGILEGMGRRIYSTRLALRAREAAAKDVATCCHMAVYPDCGLDRSEARLPPGSRVSAETGCAKSPHAETTGRAGFAAGPGRELCARGWRRRIAPLAVRASRRRWRTGLFYLKERFRCKLAVFYSGREYAPNHGLRETAAGAAPKPPQSGQAATASTRRSWPPAPSPRAPW